eukprot:gene7618-20304_t
MTHFPKVVHDDGGSGKGVWADGQPVGKVHDRGAWGGTTGAPFPCDAHRPSPPPSGWTLAARPGDCVCFSVRSPSQQV